MSTRIVLSSVAALLTMLFLVAPAAFAGLQVTTTGDQGTRVAQTEDVPNPPETSPSDVKLPEQPMTQISDPTVIPAQDGASVVQHAPVAAGCQPVVTCQPAVVQTCQPTNCCRRVFRRCGVRRRCR